MKIGYCVQGDVDEAIVRGLAERWCPDAELAEGRFRGSSRGSFRRGVGGNPRPDRGAGRRARRIQTGRTALGSGAGPTLAGVLDLPVPRMSGAGLQ